MVILSGCSAPVGAPPSGNAVQSLTYAQAAQMFTQVVNTVEPVAEAQCREQTTDLNCDFQILVDDRPNQPPNAFQTIDRNGRPIIAFTVALIADARNADELAFIFGHEAAHHIHGHIARQEQNAIAGAILAGGLAVLLGGDTGVIETVQRAGAQVGARSYSKSFELEADALGTVITLRAGYDPLKGAAFFNRIPDPGDRFLGTHPPNNQRIETVRATMARL